MGNISVIQVSRSNVTKVFKFAIRESTPGVLGLIPTEINFPGYLIVVLKQVRRQVTIIPDLMGYHSLITDAAVGI